MSLNAHEVEAVVRELAPLAGSRIDTVRAGAERSLTLELFGRAGAVRLLLSAEPDLTRLHVVAERPARGAAASPFLLLLRKEIEGARLVGIEARSGDRVVELRMATPRGEQRLVAELTGRHGNLFLVGPDGHVRAVAARNLSRRRHVSAGEPYVAPSLPDEPRAPEAIRFAPLRGDPYPLSAAIEAAYAAIEAERLLSDGRRRLRDPVRAAVASAARALVKLAEEADRVPAAEADRRSADLLKANLGRLRRGMREVTVTEWTEDGPREVTLALDPALPPRENLERAYRRYRRIVDSAARVAARAAEVREREVLLRRLLAGIDAAAPGDLERLEKEARRLGAGPRRAPPPKKRRDEPAPPHRTFRSAAGTPILVGKGAEQNDALTLRIARGNDLWIHARGRPGAHVVVRLDRGKAPDQETLLDAAHLAVHFSDARGEPQADVAYVRVKHVKKPKGAPAGAVTYSQERVILLRIEPARVERLLAEEEAEG